MTGTTTRKAIGMRYHRDYEFAGRTMYYATGYTWGVDVSDETHHGKSRQVGTIETAKRAGRALMADVPDDRVVVYLERVRYDQARYDAGANAMWVDSEHETIGYGVRRGARWSWEMYE